jgi:hypothetical protein
VFRPQQIIECNNQLRTGLERGVKVEGGQGLMELWDFLQVRGWSLISSHALLCWQRTWKCRQRRSRALSLPDVTKSKEQSNTRVRSANCDVWGVLHSLKCSTDADTSAYVDMMPVPAYQCT